MKKYMLLLMLLNLLFVLLPAKVRVVATYGYIGDIVRQVGGEAAEVSVLAEGGLDPHVISPKPSFIAKLRQADLLVINGAQLEIGWLPPVMRQANNPRIQPGANGFISLNAFVQPLDIPENVSRSQGDVHPEGNPHINLDPHNIPLFASAVKERLSQLEAASAPIFEKNLARFKEKWQEELGRWEVVFRRLKGVNVVAYHRLYDHFFRRYQVRLTGVLEPLPGIPPTTRHMTELINRSESEKTAYIFQDVYHNPKTARYVSGKTGIPIIIWPHDVGAVPEAVDIFSLFSGMARRLEER